MKVTLQAGGVGGVGKRACFKEKQKQVRETGGMKFQGG